MLTKSSYGFLEYDVTKQDMTLAYEYLDRNFKIDYNLNRKTVNNGECYRIAGILGEIVFQHLFGKRAIKSPEIDIPYDFIVNDKKIDVKCKCRNVIPKPYFEASIFSYQLTKHFNDVDVYCFMSTTKDFSKVYICGYMKKENWLNNVNGRLWKAGETDLSNNMKFKEDTYSIKYQYLDKFEL